ncbi:MAG: hypothetical protein ACI4EI_00575 [Muricoprocola sp.]
MKPYIVLTMGICVLPLIATPILTKTETNESAVEKSVAGWNLLSEVGDWYEHNFGGREMLISIEAHLKGLFEDSAGKDVIVGRDGWLYYKNSLDDYQNTDQLSDRALFNIAHATKMMQDYVEESGCEFVYTVAPNKNSIYGQYMPYYDQIQEQETGNYENLIPYLEREGVHYVDLFEILREHAGEEQLYYKTDSHWNGKGAALAADAILSEVGIQTDYYQMEFSETEKFTGDLRKMLTPALLTQEERWNPEFSFQYISDIESTFDPKIEAVSEGEKNAIVYRDSFGNELVPYLAEACKQSYFSRSVPYPLTDLMIHEADLVIAERAERFLPDTAKNPPVIPAEEIIIEEKNVCDYEISFDDEEGIVTGKIKNPDNLDIDTRILVQTESGVYEAEPCSTEESDWGFVLYIWEEPLGVFIV